MTSVLVTGSNHGISKLLLHPGRVKTRMGGWDAPLTVTESVAGMCQLVDEFSLEQSRHLLRYNGTEILWQGPRVNVQTPDFPTLRLARPRPN